MVGVGVKLGVGVGVSEMVNLTHNPEYQQFLL
jgi:hypothetical protein